MRIGIIGAGNMGGGLGRLWVAAGHEVMFGFARSDDDLADVAARAGSKARAGSAREAATFGDVLFLAVPWPALEQALTEAGSLEGKIVVSCVTPLKDDLSGLAVGQTSSAAEEIAKRTGARVAEALNSVFAEVIAADVRTFEGKRGTVFVAADDDEARAVAARLVRDAGFEPVDAGPLSSARYIEPAGMLMVTLAYRQGRGAHIGLRLVERS